MKQEKSQTILLPMPGREKVFQEFRLFDLQKTQWRIRNAKYQCTDILPLFENAKAIGIKVMYADLNFNPDILQHIGLPIYMNLQVLDIGNNFIESVECMRKLIMPRLLKLWLNNNNIVNIQGLEHCFLPQLRVLWLTDNLIKQIYWKGQWPNLSQFYIQKNNLSTINNFLKRNYPHLTWSAISSTDDEEMLINHGKWQSRLRKRFKKLQRVWMPAIFAHMERRTSG